MGCAAKGLVDDHPLVTIGDPPQDGCPRKHPVTAVAPGRERIVGRVDVKQITPVSRLLGMVQIVESIAITVGSRVHGGLIGQSHISEVDLRQMVPLGAVHLKPHCVVTTMKQPSDGIGGKHVALFMTLGLDGHLIVPSPEIRQHRPHLQPRALCR